MNWVPAGWQPDGWQPDGWQPEAEEAATTTAGGADAILFSGLKKHVNLEARRRDMLLTPASKRIILTPLAQSEVSS